MAQSASDQDPLRRTASTQLPEVVQVAERVVGKPAVTWERPQCGLTAAHRYAIRFADGSAVFVKGAADDQTAEYLRVEHATLKTVGGTFGPAIVSWLPGERPILITEHLPDYWPADADQTTRWRAGDVGAVHSALTELRTVTPPADMPLAWWPDPTWHQLVDDPALIDAGLCTPEWLERHGGLLVETDERAQSRTDCVVHGDVRSDNLCILPDGRARLVDWSMSGAGHRWQDLIMFLPTVRLEGGPDPATVFQGEVETVTRLAGPTVHRAMHFSDGPEWLGRVLRKLAVINLDWIAALLALDPPTTGQRAPLS